MDAALELDLVSGELTAIELEITGSVAIVRLANPPVNAVNRAMMLELHAAFQAISHRRDIAAVVLSAQGERAFCGGIDLKATEPDPQRKLAGELIDSGSLWRDAQHALRHCAVPVVAAVDGPAIGAGFGLVALADIIVASERATLGLTEINVGLLGGSSKALRMVGPYKTRMMFFSGELVSAAELHRYGAVERLVAPGEAESAAISLARQFAAKSPIAMRMAKESLLRVEAMAFDVEAAYRVEQDYTIRLSGFEDSREARAAFLEKRQPRWQWR
jgi:enoyl-CoA hydratase